MLSLNDARVKNTTEAIESLFYKYIVSNFRNDEAAVVDLDVGLSDI